MRLVTEVLAQLASHLASVQVGEKQGCVGPRNLLLPNEDAQTLLDALSEGIRERDAARSEVEYLCRQLEILGYHKGAAISRERAGLTGNAKDSANDRGESSMELLREVVAKVRPFLVLDSKGLLARVDTCLGSAQAKETT